MMSAILIAFFAGAGVGVAFQVSMADRRRFIQDARLRNENTYLHGEVMRLREQVAFHINPGRPEDYREGQRIVEAARAVH